MVGGHCARLLDRIKGLGNLSRGDDDEKMHVTEECLLPDELRRPCHAAHDPIKSHLISLLT